MGELILVVGAFILCVNALIVTAIVVVLALEGICHPTSRFHPGQSGTNDADWPLWEEQLLPAGRR